MGKATLYHLCFDKLSDLIDDVVNFERGVELHVATCLQLPYSINKVVKKNGRPVDMHSQSHWLFTLIYHHELFAEKSTSVADSALVNLHLVHAIECEAGPGRCVDEVRKRVFDVVNFPVLLYSQVPQILLIQPATEINFLADHRLHIDW